MLGSASLVNQSVATYADGEAAGRHGQLYSGESWYVDSVNGDDANSGAYPDVSFATIAAALAVAAAGDIILLGTGTYDEAVDLNLVGLELHGEVGAILTNTTPGTVLTVSANYCLVEGITLIEAGQIGVLLTGNQCLLKDIRSGPGNSVGFDINGTGNILERCHAGRPTVTGFDVGANGNTLRECDAIGDGAATRGFYVSGGVRSRFYRCASIGNMTAGYEVVFGADNNLFSDCRSGALDGLRIDDGLHTAWPRYIGILEEWPHEESYPEADGEGTAVTFPAISSQANDATDAAATTRWYWGEPSILIPRNTITNMYYLFGLHVQFSTASKLLQWQVFTGTMQLCSLRDGGNDWDEGATVLTVTDGTLFQANDLVAIYSGVDVEIVRVSGDPVGNEVTIVRETVNMPNPNGLRWDHTTGDPGTEYMCVVERATDPLLHSSIGHYLTLADGISPRFLFAGPKVVDANGFVIMRIMNMTDAVDSAMGLSSIVEH